MHIPDGYLSPSTCALAYASAAPFWYVALQKVKRQLHTRFVPLISVFSAFSFVIMMFNLPLPGGTTGHATGVGLAAVVLGPWAGMLAISVALVIQAIFFGDGGITAIGANCFNIAIVGSLVASLVYRLTAGTSPMGSSRRLVAAGLAGYAGINAAAFLTAIEFGLQPLLFHDASGTPLYAPYSLSIAIPAMMIGHLTFAGFAEFLVSAGVISYLQRTDPALLAREAPAADSTGEVASLRKLWAGLALMMILTPLGLLAVGTAWGEWSPDDFSKPETRQEIAAVNRGQVPAQAPAGLQKLSTIWTAPIPDYAPPILKSPGFGYVLSAMAGTGLIILFSLLWGSGAAMSEGLHHLVHRRKGFLDRTLAELSHVVDRSFSAELSAAQGGFLQQIDARTKLASAAILIGTAAASKSLTLIGSIWLVAVVLALGSRLRVRELLTLWTGVFLFSGVIALPALFLTPGESLWRVPVFGWNLSMQGLRSASFLLARVVTTSTLGSILVSTTPWNQLLRAMRAFHLPVVAVVLIGMTYRYIFLFIQTTMDMLEGRQSRLAGELPAKLRRTMALATVGVLMSKAFELSSDVHLAMQARGYRGEVHVLDESPLMPRDWALLGGLLALSLAGYEYL